MRRLLTIVPLTSSCIWCPGCDRRCLRCYKLRFLGGSCDTVAMGTKGTVCTSLANSASTYARPNVRLLQRSMGLRLPCVNPDIPSAAGQGAQAKVHTATDGHRCAPYACGRAAKAKLALQLLHTVHTQTHMLWRKLVICTNAVGRRFQDAGQKPCMHMCPHARAHRIAHRAISAITNAEGVRQSLSQQNASVCRG